MKTFVCERCGKSYNSYGDEKVHLCEKCTDEIINWVREKLDFVIDASVTVVRGRY